MAQNTAARERLSRYYGIYASTMIEKCLPVIIVTILAVQKASKFVILCHLNTDNV